MKVAVEVEGVVKFTRQRLEESAVAGEVDFIPCLLPLGKIHGVCARVQNQAIYPILIIENEISDTLVA